MSRCIPNHLLVVVSFALLLVCGSPEMNAEVVQTKIDSFYHRLNSDCGNSFDGINADFETTFSESAQADVLAEVIERSAKEPKDTLILANAIYFEDAFVRRNGTKPWSSRLESTLLAQAHHPNFVVRESLAKMLIHRHESQWRELNLSFLQDDNDDVRERVLNEINRSGWPDALAIDAAYIKSTQPEGTYHKSVVSAKRYTNPKDNERAEQICQMSIRPDAQKNYLEYIAQHRADPDYEVSVDTAERFYESIQANINFKKAEDDEKKRVGFLHANKDFHYATVVDETSISQFQPRPGSEQVDFMYWLFDTKDSTTCQYACRYCKLVVPPNNQVQLVTEIAERATHDPVNNDVLLNVLMFSEHQRSPSPQVGVWSEKLGSLVWQQKGNPDRRIRNYIIRYINGWATAGYRDRVLSFLNDKDTDVLQGAIDAIDEWPDRIEIYSRYLAEHRGDSTYAAGVHFIHDLEIGW